MKYKIPSFGYPGGKVKLRRWLVKRMPISGGKYAEPFVGRGNVFWLAAHMLDYKEWWLNDPWTARWFEAIQKVRLSDIPYQMTELLNRFYKKRALNARDVDDVAVAIESLTMFSGGAKGGISMDILRRASTLCFKRNIRDACAILRMLHPRITALDWDCCGLEKLCSHDFVYFDPPYESATAAYYYDTVDHRDLLIHLLNADYLWMISGYSSPLYRSYLGSPEATKKSRISMHQPNTVLNKIKVECIWTNYTIGDDGVVRRKSLRRTRIKKRAISVVYGHDGGGVFGHDGGDS